MQSFIDDAEAVVSKEQASHSRLGSHALLRRVRCYDSLSIQDALDQVYANQPSRLPSSWRLVQCLSKPQ